MPSAPVAASPLKDSPGTFPENCDTDAPWPQLVSCASVPPPTTARNEVPISSSRMLIERAGAEVGSFQGSSVAAGAASSAPNARASPATACANAAPSPESLCPASVKCEPAPRGVSSRPVTAAMASEAAAHRDGVPAAERALARCGRGELLRGPAAPGVGAGQGRCAGGQERRHQAPPQARRRRPQPAVHPRRARHGLPDARARRGVRAGLPHIGSSPMMPTARRPTTPARGTGPRGRSGGGSEAVPRRAPADQNAAFTPIMMTSERAESSLWVRSDTTSPRSSLTFPPLKKFRGAKPST